jgi:hypothetical protein
MNYSQNPKFFFKPKKEKGEPTAICSHAGCRDSPFRFIRLSFFRFDDLALFQLNCHNKTDTLLLYHIFGKNSI